MPSLAKLAIVFGFIVILLWRKVNLAIALTLGAAVLGFFFSMTPLEIIVIALKASIARDTLSVVLALILIMIYEHFMKEDGMLSDLIAGAKGFFHDRRIVMAFLPSFIGFLPSAGGALFSAPMVREVSEGLPLSPEMRSLFNYWFRHVWEFLLPVYPGMLMAAQLSGIPISLLVAYQSRFWVVALILGLILCFRGPAWAAARENPGAEDKSGRSQSLGLMARGLIPMACIISFVLALKMEVALAVGLVFSALLALRRYRLANLPSLARRSVSLPTALVVVGAMIFKEVLGASGAVERVPAELVPLGVSPVVMMMIIAFVVGLLTGYAPAAIAISFPLLQSTVLTATTAVVPLASLAYVAAFAGIMLSPTHLCFALTVQYFRAQFLKVWTKVAAGEIAIVASAVLSFILAGGRF